MLRFSSAARGWHVEPVTDGWDLPVKKIFTIDHPNAPRAKQVRATGKKKTSIALTRTQIPLAPEFPVTFQGIQGTTVRGPEKQPKGFVLDLFRPQTMRGEEREPEYFQHLYMALGRAQKLEWLLLRNFPINDEGDMDWSIFEKGPPDFLVEFLASLETKARKTWPKLERAQRQLGMPAWADVPHCDPDPVDKGRYLYDPCAWGRQASASLENSPAQRLVGKRPPLSPVTLLGAQAAGPTPSKQSTSRMDVDRPPPPKRRKVGKGSPSQQPESEPCPSTHRARRAWSMRPHPELPTPSDLAPLCEPHSWYNSRSTDAVSAAGIQCGSTCGLHAFNHVMAGVCALQRTRFRPTCQAAFENLALQARLGDSAGNLVEPYDVSVLTINFTSRSVTMFPLLPEEIQERLPVPFAPHSEPQGVYEAIAYIIRTPQHGGHWIAAIRPLSDLSRQQPPSLAWLCDSMYPTPHVLPLEGLSALLTICACEAAHGDDFGRASSWRCFLVAVRRG